MSGNAFFDLLLVAIPVIFIRLWWTGSRARELATQHASLACRQRQLQFLDQTVARTAIRFARTASGESCLQRDYEFEFTDEGAHRDIACLTMHGHALESIHFPYTRDADGHRIYSH